jgi:hypothetical protein
LLAGSTGLILVRQIPSGQGRAANSAIESLPQLFPECPIPTIALPAEFSGEDQSMDDGFVFIVAHDTEHRLA